MLSANENSANSNHFNEDGFQWLFGAFSVIQYKFANALISLKFDILDARRTCRAF
jgi:hypothetical protein